MSTTQTTPYQRRYRLVTGTDWEGVRLRELDGSGVPIVAAISCGGTVRTGPTGLGGEVVAQASVSDQDGDGYFTVTLPSATTVGFPLRTLFLDVVVAVSDVVKVPVQIELEMVGSTTL